MIHRERLAIYTIPALLLFAGFATIGRAGDAEGDWSQFRGPQGNGVAAQAHPTRWSDKQNLAWSTEISGGGWSSPVAADGRIFLTTAVSSDDSRPKGFGEGVSSMRSFFQSKPPAEPLSFEVHCVDLADGSLLWKRQIVSRKPPHKIHPSNSYATESPVTDGQHVYAYFAAVGIVACVDLSGELVWQRDIGAYRTSSDFGTASSLAMLDGRLFVQCDNEEESFVCGLDTKTGADVWRVERSGRTSWSSPLIWTNRVRTELVVCGSGNVTAYEPSTGSILWKLSGTGGAFSAFPTSDSERIYFGNSGRNSRGPLVAVNAGAVGELTLDSIGDDGVAWVEETSAPGMCSPVVVLGRLYVLSQGILSCHDAETGERLYRQRLPDAQRVTSSLWAAEDKVFALNESGQTLVIKAGDKFDLLTSNQTNGLFWSTPSVAGTSLLLRGARTLRCIRQ
jgi:outer membrane protein assembly factor BamB